MDTINKLKSDIEKDGQWYWQNSLREIKKKPLIREKIVPNIFNNPDESYYIKNISSNFETDSNLNAILNISDPETTRDFMINSKTDLALDSYDKMRLLKDFSKTSKRSYNDILNSGVDDILVIQENLKIKNRKMNIKFLKK